MNEPDDGEFVDTDASQFYMANAVETGVARVQLRKGLIMLDQNVAMLTFPDADLVLQAEGEPLSFVRSSLSMAVPLRTLRFLLESLNEDLEELERLGEIPEDAGQCIHPDHIHPEDN